MLGVWKKLNGKISKRGFTLIELLVVIVIIGILTTIAVASFTSAQKKSRDSRRKADLDAVRKALWLMKSDRSDGRVVTCGVYVGIGYCRYPADIGLPLAPTYMKVEPSDPSPGSGASATPYLYFPTNSAGTGCDNVTTFCTKFQLWACLENASDPTADDNDDDIPSGACFSRAEYGVTEDGPIGTGNVYPSQP